MSTLSYARHRFPPVIIQHAVWLYFRFALSYRDVEDLLAERGIDASYETVRRWVFKLAAPMPHGYAGAGHGLLTAGTWTRCSSGSAARSTISGVPLTTRAKSSTSSCSRGVTGRQPSSSCAGC